MKRYMTIIAVALLCQQATQASDRKDDDNPGGWDFDLPSLKIKKAAQDIEVSLGGSFSFGFIGGSGAFGSACASSAPGRSSIGSSTAFCTFSSSTASLSKPSCSTFDNQHPTILLSNH